MNNLFATGAQEIREKPQGGTFVKITEEGIELVPLVSLEGRVFPQRGEHQHWDIQPVVIYPCFGPENDCPGCKLGNVPKKKYYLPVLVKGGEPVQSIWGFGPMIDKQLRTLEKTIVERDGDPTGLEGKTLLITKTGAGKKTKYQVTQRPKVVDVSDIPMEDFTNRLGLTDIDLIWARLEGRDVPRADSDDDDGWDD